MPLFGFGTWLSKPNVVGDSVRKALENGYRHIDCASVYGNEPEVGKAFSDFFGSGSVKREEVFITSKLWVSDFGNVQEACDKTLADLQLEYLDLYLIHLPFEVDAKTYVYPPQPKGHGVIGYKAERIEEVWKDMEALVTAGKVKSIGVSNFTINKLKALLKCPLQKPVACNQIELHPYCPQHKLVEYCEENNIMVVAFGPLGNPGNPDVEKTAPHLLSDPIVKSISEKHNATAAHVLISFGLERKTGVLVKSVNENRIKENISSLKVKLDTDDMVALNSISNRYRYCKQLWARKAEEEEPDLWDGEFSA